MVAVNSNSCCGGSSQAIGKLKSSLENLRIRLQSEAGPDESDLEMGKQSLQIPVLPESEQRFHANQLEIVAKYAREPASRTAGAKWAAMFHLRQVQSRLKSWLAVRSCKVDNPVCDPDVHSEAQSCCCSSGKAVGNSPESGE